MRNKYDGMRFKSDPRQDVDYIRGYLRFICDRYDIPHDIFKESRIAQHAREGFCFYDAFTDNCKPMLFWAMQGCPPRDYPRVPYHSEWAKDAIKNFREYYKIGKKHWKWLCNRHEDYLIYYFAMGVENRLRVPLDYLRPVPMRFGPLEPDCTLSTSVVMEQSYINMTRQLDRFREYTAEIRTKFVERDIPFELFVNVFNHFYDNGDLPEAVSDMNILLSDMIDALRGVPRTRDPVSHIKKFKNIFKVRDDLTYDQWAGKIHTFEQRVITDMAYHNRMNGNHHTFTVMKYRGNSVPRDPDEVYEHVKAFPEVIEMPKKKGYKATLIKNEGMLTEEGERMSHCIGNLYRSRIARGVYVAYHIDIPNVKHGVTVGIERNHKRCTDPTTFDVAVKVSWVHDQTRGKLNSTTSDPHVQTLREILLTELNKTVEEEVMTQDEFAERFPPRLSSWSVADDVSVDGVLLQQGEPFHIAPEGFISLEENPFPREMTMEVRTIPRVERVYADLHMATFEGEDCDPRDAISDLGNRISRERERNAERIPPIEFRARQSMGRIGRVRRDEDDYYTPFGIGDITA